MITRIKSWLAAHLTYEQRLFIVVVLLVGVVSYALGQQAGYLASQAAAGPRQPAIVFTAAPSDTGSSTAVPVVASRSGTRYHRLDCPGAATIKEANLIRFASIELARSAGYLPAGNCPGLR